LVSAYSVFEILLFRTVFQTGQFSTFILEILWILPSFVTRASRSARAIDKIDLEISTDSRRIMLEGNL
jgi:hypothetical protein